MSDASDPKVEDVLTSVRRLVSGELPRQPRRDISRGDGALVLTEAHRIETTSDSADTPKSLEDKIAELEVAVGGRDEEFEPDGSEDQSMHQPDRMIYTPHEPDEVVASRIARRLSESVLGQDEDSEVGPDANKADDVIFDETPTFRHSSEPVAEAPMAEDVPLQPRTRSEVAAFSDPDDMAANIDARILSGRPVTEPLKLVEPSKVPENETNSDDGTAVDRSDEDLDSALSAAIAASIAPPEDPAAETEDPDTTEETVQTVEPFGFSQFDLNSRDPEITAGQMLSDPEIEIGPTGDRFEAVVRAMSDTAPPSEDAATQDEGQANGSTPETGATNANAEAAAALDALSNEDAVRLLVARLLRQELQGELGERITRNVRKLVRREIKQALNSHDLT